MVWWHHLWHDGLSKMVSVCEEVFVYGSLKTGLSHHDQMRGAVLLGPSRVRGAFLVLYEESFPAMVLTGAEGVVFGELYRVTLDHLLRLDEFEECPTLYERKRVQLEGGASAWAYVIHADRAARYPSLGSSYEERNERADS